MAGQWVKGWGGNGPNWYAFVTDKDIGPPAAWIGVVKTPGYRLWTRKDKPRWDWEQFPTDLPDLESAMAAARLLMG